MCGLLTTEGQSSECRANRPGNGAPVWKLELNDEAIPMGGAIVPGRIYVTTLDGNLYAIEDPAH
jgi:outer membrane protein assembly factor BamB